MIGRGVSRLAGVARARGAAYVRHSWSRGIRDAARSALAKELSEHTEKLHRDVLRPINKRLLGPLEKESQNFPSMPFVLLLGNHSSGKSTFINYVLGAEVQKAGVAPTDDSFTIIAPAKANLDQDGPALVGDPDLGFSGLRVFGTSLINHINLKVRTCAARRGALPEPTAVNRRTPSRARLSPTRPTLQPPTPFRRRRGRAWRSTTSCLWTARA